MQQQRGRRQRRPWVHEEVQNRQAARRRGRRPRRALVVRLEAARGGQAPAPPPAKVLDGPAAAACRRGIFVVIVIVGGGGSGSGVGGRAAGAAGLWCGPWGHTADVRAARREPWEPREPGPRPSPTLGARRRPLLAAIAVAIARPAPPAPGARGCGLCGMWLRLRQLVSGVQCIDKLLSGQCARGREGGRGTGCGVWGSKGGFR